MVRPTNHPTWYGLHLGVHHAQAEKTVSVRVDAEDYKYLQLLAHSNEQTIADAISNVIKQFEQAKPIGFCIWKIIHNDGSETYDVTLPYGGYI